MRGGSPLTSILPTTLVRTRSDLRNVRFLIRRGGDSTTYSKGMRHTAITVHSKLAMPSPENAWISSSSSLTGMTARPLSVGMVMSRWRCGL